MDDKRHPVVSKRHKALRCFPFVAVALCFLLPMFSVSSCGEGQTTVESTGIEVVLGADPVVVTADKQTRQSDRTIESEARSISQAARPWAIAALILAIAGIVLMVTTVRLHRIVAFAVAVAAFGALAKVWGAVDVQSGDGTPGGGLLLASAVLFLAAVWQAGALTFLAVRSALNPELNPEWEAQRGESSQGSPRSRRRTVGTNAPGRNRTYGLALRRRTLYPLSYRRGRAECISAGGGPRIG